MKRIIFGTFLLIAFSFIENVQSQTNVKILDLSVIPLMSNDSIPSDSIELVIHFKINKPEDALNVHFWLGTAMDDFSIMSATPTFSTIGGITTLTYNGESTDVKNYTTSFNVKVSNSDYTTHTLKATLFVETITGQFTTRLYY